MPKRSPYVLVLVLCAVIGCGLGQCGEAPPRPEPATPVAAENHPAIGSMVLVPAGKFGMGCPSPDDKRCGDFYHEVELGAFHIDAYEVTGKEFQACIAAGACAASSVPGLDLSSNKPAQSVTWDQAVEYCRWAGKRLPTSQEWEKAARGDEGGHDFPWGDAWQPTWTNWCDGDGCDGGIDGYADAAPVDAFPRDVSPYGARNMGGNVAEWTSTPTDAAGTHRVIRGGSFSPPNQTDPSAPSQMLLMWVASSDPTTFRPAHLGFRCAKDAD